MEESLQITDKVNEMPMKTRVHGIQVIMNEGFWFRLMELCGRRVLCPIIIPAEGTIRWASTCPAEIRRVRYVAKFVLY